MNEQEHPLIPARTPDDAPSVGKPRQDTITPLYDTMAGPLKAYAYQILKDWPEAEDVVQEAFLKLHTAQLEDDKRKCAWLYTVVRNRALDLANQRELRGGYTIEELEESGSHSQSLEVSHPYHYPHLKTRPASAEEILKTLVDQGALTEEIETVQKLLNPDYWTSVKARKGEKQPRSDKIDYVQITKSEGISKATAYQRVHRLRGKALKTLRRMGGMAALRELAARALAGMRAAMEKAGANPVATGGTFVLILCALLWIYPPAPPRVNMNSTTLPNAGVGQNQAFGSITAKASKDAAATGSAKQRSIGPKRAVTGGGFAAGMEPVDLQIIYREDELSEIRRSKINALVEGSFRKVIYIPIPATAQIDSFNGKGVVFTSDWGPDSAAYARFAQGLMEMTEAEWKNQFVLQNAGSVNQNGRSPYLNSKRMRRMIYVLLPDRRTFGASDQFMQERPTRLTVLKKLASSKTGGLSTLGENTNGADQLFPPNDSRLRVGAGSNGGDIGFPRKVSAPMMQDEGDGSTRPPSTTDQGDGSTSAQQLDRDGVPMLIHPAYFWPWIPTRVPNIPSMWGPRQ